MKEFNKNAALEETTIQKKPKSKGFVKAVVAVIKDLKDIFTTKYSAEMWISAEPKDEMIMRGEGEAYDMHIEQEKKEKEQKYVYDTLSKEYQDKLDVYERNIKNIFDTYEKKYWKRKVWSKDIKKEYKKEIKVYDDLISELVNSAK